jgi:hypothetical protein
MGTIRNGVREYEYGSFVPLNAAEREAMLGKFDLCMFTGEIKYGRLAVVGAMNEVRKKWEKFEELLLSRERPEGVVYLYQTPLSLYGAAKIQAAFGCVTVGDLISTVSLSSFYETQGISSAVKDEFKGYCDRRGLCFANS